MESKAEFYYSELMAQYTNSKSTKKEVMDQAKAYYDELKGFMKSAIRSNCTFSAEWFISSFTTA